MKQFVILLILFWTSFNMVAQEKNKALITIGARSFSKEEFVYIYQKNNNNLFEESEKKSPSDYTDLFINFKLKVIEAENLKMDTSQSFINELAGYRKELAAPYLTDVSFNEKLVIDTYQRMKTELKASHILIGINKSNTPIDTLEAYNKAINIREEIINGLDFKEAADKYSTDPSAKINHGDLGYFSAFQMVFPFENGAFNTPVGKISMPVRSAFGYHLIKVEDLREAKGELKVAHIMKSFPPNCSDGIKKQLKSQIDSIYSLLINGADFAKMAKQYSDDKRSSEQGGELAWFSSGRMIADFANPAFELKKKNDLSKPITTRFGYHIIKRIDYKPVKKFSEVKNEIENRIKKDPARSNHSKEAFIKKLKNEYNYDYNHTIYDNFKNKTYHLNSNKNQLPQNILTDNLIQINGKGFKTELFLNFIADKNNPTIKNEAFNSYFNEWVETVLTDFENSRLEEKYPEFKNLINEYHDGILLFNISDKKIWTHAMNDSIGLIKYYKNNKGAYLWDERFKGIIIKCNSQKVRDDVEKYFSVGMTPQEILDKINEVEEKVWIEEGTWEKNTNPIVNFYVWSGEKPDNFNDALEFIRGDKIAPEPKLLDEAKGLYLSDYQTYLEKEWIKTLRKKYKIRINKKLLKTIDNA